MSNVLMVMAPERFRDEELFETQDELRRAGHQTRLASTCIGLCPGARGGQARAEMTLEQVDVAEYEAVVFVGGGGSKLLWNNETAWRIARDMAQSGKVVAAICLAPVILANAGVLVGKRATVAGIEATTIEAKGARYAGPGVTVDGKLVTANGPKSSRRFGQCIGELLREGSGA